MNPRQGSVEAASPPQGYTSEILKMFIKTLGCLNNAQILDVGPICEENIMFFSQWIRRHFVCDMFLRLSRELSKGDQAGNVWRHLDYPARSFDAIQLWDLCDHLDDRQVGKLVELSYCMLQPEGLMMIVAFENPPSLSQINTFIIRHDYRIGYRLQSHLKLDWYCRHNRALMSLLAGFTIIKSLRYRNGIREVLLKKPLNSA
jgi:hypothetical protein